MTDFSWADQTVLVTGATGSFGRRFIELALAELKPKKLIVFSRDELKQHDMRVAGFEHPSLRFFIGDVRDVDRLRRAMHGVTVVVHAAALKQVPACEYNPFEAVQTNINGTKNVIDAAIDTGVARVLALSTDKAVNPVNLYGATKLVAEKLVVQANAYGLSRGTRFAAVRYGNVIGSRGSVVPLFLAQRKAGRITVTDASMTRFWLSLTEGVHFVMRAIEAMHGGEVFVPKLRATSIDDLARTIAPGCAVDVIGVRPGEKLHEVLLSEDEARHSVDAGDLFVIRPLHPWWSDNAWVDAKPLPAGFRLASDTCPRIPANEIPATLRAAGIEISP